MQQRLIVCMPKPLADGDADFQKLVGALQKNVESDFVDSYQQEKTGLNQYFATFIRSLETSPTLEQGPSALVRELVWDKQIAISQKIDACHAYGMTLRKISDGHKHLASNANAIDSSAVLGAMRRYSDDLARLLQIVEERKKGV